MRLPCGVLWVLRLREARPKGPDITAWRAACTRTLLQCNAAPEVGSPAAIQPTSLAQRFAPVASRKLRSARRPAAGHSRHSVHGAERDRRCLRRSYRTPRRLGSACLRDRLLPELVQPGLARPLRPPNPAIVVPLGTVADPYRPRRAETCRTHRLFLCGDTAAAVGGGRRLVHDASVCDAGGYPVAGRAGSTHAGAGPRRRISLLPSICSSWRDRARAAFWLSSQLRGR